MATLDQMMAAAGAACDAGRIQDAEQICRQVLQLQPQHAQALHAMGFLALRRGDREAALKLMQQSIDINPASAEFRNNIGNLLREMGRPAQAMESYRKALELRPGFWAAWYNLGETLRQQKQAGEASECYRKVLAIKPAHAKALHHLGSLLAEQGQWEEAERCFGSAIEADRGFAEAYVSLGNAIARSVRLARAEARGRAATGGVAGRIAQAIAAYQRAIELRSDHVAAYTELGNLLVEIGRPDEAIQWHRKAVALNPQSPEAYCELGMALRWVPQPEEVEACFRKAIEIRPDSPWAWNNLSSILVQQGRLPEAMEHRRRAIEISPEYAQAHSNLLLDLHYRADCDRQAVLAEHQLWAERHAGKATRHIQPHANGRDPHRRLRIGYLSPDFRRHAAAYFMEPILINHDRARFEVFCYSAVLYPDIATVRFRELAEQWREVSGRPDQEVADLIRADGIDILVDLAGHTADNRLLVLAYKPAPVQMTYLGYPDTTGLPTVDYRLTDAIADPPGLSEAYHTERLLRLDGCFLCYRPPEDAPEVAGIPARGCGHVTFGCFNKIPKITSAMLRLWAGILRATPGSRLLLKDLGFTSAQVRASVLAALSREGIGSECVELLRYETSYANHLGLYSRMDVALDTFPYCGATTTCDALWMGVPVVSLAGQAHVSRVGHSLLHAAGLPELAAGDEQEYAAIAKGLAADLGKLAAMRAGLRERMRQSRLLDAPRFTRGLEDAYRLAWARWCSVAGPA